MTISNGTLSIQNDSFYKVLKAKLAVDTTQNAILWYPKAEYLQYRTDEINKYIETTISNLRDDSSALNIDTLYKKLDFYKSKLLRIDPDIYTTIHKKAEIITHDFDSIKLNMPERFNIYFLTKSKDEKLFILNQTKNNIKIIENEVLIFCNDKIK